MQAALSEFVADPSFPCVMAKAVMSKGYVSNHIFSENHPEQVAPAVLSAMNNFVDHYRDDRKTLSTFVVSFDAPEFLDFGHFENFFWKLLGTMDALDKEKFEHDSRVASDPTAADFSFSIKGEAFFMLVLHPQSPRLARRFSTPTIVFNAHQQFEDLRAKGLFHKVRDLIRKRDISLQGFMNPMVKDFGTVSEVFQYTGREYASESKCPFHRASKYATKWMKELVS
jgi:FPC/CPF motif-containing protein YcgG